MKILLIFLFLLPCVAFSLEQEKKELPKEEIDDYYKLLGLAQKVEKLPVDVTITPRALNWLNGYHFGETFKVNLHQESFCSYVSTLKQTKPEEYRTLCEDVFLGLKRADTMERGGQVVLKGRGRDKSMVAAAPFLKGLFHRLSVEKAQSKEELQSAQKTIFRQKLVGGAAFVGLIALRWWGYL